MSHVFLIIEDLVALSCLYLSLQATKKMASLDKGKRWAFSNRDEDSMHNVR
jgi:hypothetical protein